MENIKEEFEKYLSSKKIIFEEVKRKLDWYIKNFEDFVGPSNDAKMYDVVTINKNEIFFENANYEMFSLTTDILFVDGKELEEYAKEEKRKRENFLELERQRMKEVRRKEYLKLKEEFEP